MPDPQHTGDADDPRLNALIAWRQRLIDSGAVSKAGFKETHLRLILRSGRTDVDQIRAMLPGSVAEYAEELAAVLAEVESEPSPGRHHRSAALSAVDAAAEPTGTAPLADGATHDQLPLAPSDFATYTFGEQTGPLAAVTVRPPRDDQDADGCELAWTPYLPGGDAVVIYRLVAQEDNAPYSPDRARLVAATSSTTAADPVPSAAAVRYYQVWVNVGTTRAEALAAQPVKHAEGVAVSPARDCVVRQDDGKVIGRWTVPAAVSTVFVSRMPAEEAGREGPQHRILLDRDNRAGFVDPDPAPGRRYVYRIRAAVPVNGVLRLSAPVDAEVEIAAVLTPVTDLMVTSAPGTAEGFELTWKAPPAGEVVIYRSQTGPAAGAEASDLPEAALEQVGLTPDLRLTQPVSEQPGPDGRPRSVMSGVSWPTDWSRAYFTPVTVLAGRALLGKTFCSVRTGVIRDVELAEYCNKQVLTFDWPQGAAVVVVYLAPKGYDPRNGLTGTSYEITVEQYEKYGGLQLPNGKLPVSGCSLHLAPVAFSAGRRAIGAVRSIEYAGLLRLQYAVQLSRDPVGQPSHATIYMRSEYEVPGSPAFVLVNHPDRIPLSPTDGEALDAAPLDAQGGLAATPSKELRWSALTTAGTAEPWAVDLRGRRGWIRLFVNTPSAARLRTIALLAPPVHSLRLTVGAP